MTGPGQADPGPAGLADPRPVRPVTRPFDVSIRPPGSKSLTNRALVLAALAAGRSTITGLLTDADDARVMLSAVQALGARVELSGAGPASVAAVTGVGGRWQPVSGPWSALRLDLANAGTAVRFLTAAAVLSPVPIMIDGDARMRQRPIGELVAMLSALGARAAYAGEPGVPPVVVYPADPALLAPELIVGATASSQFVSALLLIAPWMPRGLAIRFGAGITSQPYVRMTLALLAKTGAAVSDELPDRAWAGPPRVADPHRPAAPGLGGFELEIEADASGAAPFWAAAALCPGSTCRVRGVPEPSLQGDAAFPAFLARLGATVGRRASDGSIGVRGPARFAGFEADLSAMPDTAMVAAVLACFASPTPANPAARSTITGLATLRVKESDRIAALARELSKLGAAVEPGPDRLAITPPAPGGGAAPIEFDTYRDHRMAMALALVGLRRPGVSIRDPGCVTKTYPAFWADLGRLYDTAP